MDVVAFGEAMLRLTPPNFRRIEQTYQFDLEIGGAELNTLVGLACLGRSVAWVSRICDNPLGRLLCNRVRETGVKTDHVQLVPEGRVGLYFLEQGAAPRPDAVYYDRIGSTVSLTRTGRLDWPKILSGAKWFYLTGITPAISASCAAVALEALQTAKGLGLWVCLDPNYRSMLWSVESATRWLNEAISFVDVLITNPEDAQRFFSLKNDQEPENVCRGLLEQYPQLQAVALTTRETLSVWKNRITGYGGDRQSFFRSPCYEVEIVDRLGAGDAFAAGLLHGLLEGDLQKGVEWGMAAAALKHTIPGDLPWLRSEEIEALRQGSGLKIRR
ncbi:MAG: sugar kinase [Gemmataceae bacterium]|nr:sugar kinase [Gemmataceae bacterium]